jgi:hypothetical protein
MKHYVYVYLNPLKKGNYNYGKFNFEYEPFYIGIGINNRINQHITEAKSKKGRGINKLKINIILKIIENNQEPIRYKLYENISIYSAKRMERYLINLIGRRDLNLGVLSNHTNGGEETPFYKKTHSEDTIKKIKNTIGDSRKGEKNSNYGNKWSTEQRTVASKKQKETHKNFIGDNNPAKNDKIRKKISETKIGNKNPNAKKWLLISPDKKEYIIDGGLKRNLKEFNLTYSMFEYYKDEEKRNTKNGWVLKSF